MNSELGNENCVISSVRTALRRTGKDQDKVKAGSRFRNISPNYRAQADADIDVVDLFLEVVAEYKASVIKSSSSSLSNKVSEAISNAGIKSIVVPPGFDASFVTGLDGVQLIVDGNMISKEVLADTDAVLTGCSFAIASTGTVVLTGQPNEGRRIITLLPDFHFCVVDSKDIVADVDQVIVALDPVAPITFISGPSATSDIELSRVEGVHGPRNLTVFVVDDRFQ